MVEAYFPIFFCLFLHPQNRQIEFGCLILEDLAQSTIFYFFFFFLLTHCFQNKLRHGLLKKAMIWKLKKSYTMPVIEVEITVRPLFLSEVPEEVNELSGTCSSTAADCCHCGWIWEEILVNLLDRKLLILGNIVLWICFTLLLIIIWLSI